MYGYCLNDPVNLVDPFGLHTLTDPTTGKRYDNHSHENWQKIDNAGNVVVADADKNSGHIRFFPAYEGYNDIIKKATDYHEILHVENPDTPHSEIYKKELEFLQNEIRYINPTDPMREEVEDYIDALTLEMIKLEEEERTSCPKS